MSDSIENISLYIPHVFANISAERISYSFEQYIGKVSRVDLVSKIDKTGKFYNAAYIHFTHWYNSDAAYNFQSRVLDDEAVAKFVYDDPWHWVVLENKSKKHLAGSRRQRINLTDFAVVQAPDQDYCLLDNYIPEYNRISYYVDRNYANSRIKENNKIMNDIIDDGTSASITRKEIEILSNLSLETGYYEEWLATPIPKVSIDEEMEKILDEMDDVEDYCLQQEKRDQNIEIIQNRINALKKQLVNKQEEQQAL